MANKVIAKKMPDAAALILDKQNYYKQVLCGYYQFDCVMSEQEKRSAKFYVPCNSRYNQPTVFVMIPDGTDPYEFLIASGWKQTADENGIYLVVMEPGPTGHWEQPEKEACYVEMLYGKVSARPLFCAFAPFFYGAAYGNAADVLLWHCTRNPERWAGILLAGVSGLTLKEKKILENLPSKVAGISVNQVQLPIWLVCEKGNDDEKRLADYFRKANHSMASCTLEEDGTCVCRPEAGGSADEHWCAPVMVTAADWKHCLGGEFAGKVYTHLFRGRCRYAGDANGALRFHEDIYERGFEKFSADVWGGFWEDHSDMYRRVWWVYVPECVKNNSQKQESVPAVFLFHGAGGSGDEIGDRSGWADVAERYGLILVCPSASNENRVRPVKGMMVNNMFRSRWNTGKPEADFPGDIYFVDYLYRWVCERYPVDPARIYASGQSSGGMMTWACAAYRPDYFAAVAPVSAKDINKVSETLEPTVGSVIPIMANMGMEDRIFAGGFSTPEAKKLIDYWCRRFSLDKTWSDYGFMKDGENCSYEQGKWIHYLFRTKKGVPLLHCIETRTKTHAIWPSECEMIWKEWFSDFQKDPETKTLFYKGTPVTVY